MHAHKRTCKCPKCGTTTTLPKSYERIGLGIKRLLNENLAPGAAIVFIIAPEPSEQGVVKPFIFTNVVQKDVTGILDMVKKAYEGANEPDGSI